MRATALSAAVLFFSVASISAQSLADVAKKEEERRKQTPPPTKVYTNKDLVPAPPVSMPPPASADTKAEAPKDTATTDTNASEKTKTPAKDEKYWRERMKNSREAADRDQTLADAMQSRINALTTDFVNRDDPAQRSVIERDRNRALAELERLKKAIIDDKKAVTDLEEEARRAGVPPGWLR